MRFDIEFNELFDERVIDFNALEFPSRNSSAPNYFDGMFRVRLDRLLKTEESVVD